MRAAVSAGQAGGTERGESGESGRRRAEQDAGGQAAGVWRNGKPFIDIGVGGFAEGKQVVDQQLCALARGRKHKRKR